MFDSVGFALEDLAALDWLHEAAVELGLGRTIELVPRAEDPKNLFGVLGASAVARQQDARLGVDDALDQAHPLEHLRQLGHVLRA